MYVYTFVYILISKSIINSLKILFYSILVLMFVTYASTNKYVREIYVLKNLKSINSTYPIKYNSYLKRI